MFRPSRNLLINLSGSYLKTEIKDLLLSDPRDVSGGRTDTVIIKDVTNASNCAVVPNTAGNALGANTLVTAFNGALGLAGPVPVPGTNTTGAFSICDALAATIANPSAPLRGLFATPTGPLPFTVIAGRPARPQRQRAAAGAELEILGRNPVHLPPRQRHDDRSARRLSLIPATSGRAASTSRSTRSTGYEVVNAQIQVNGKDERWFARAFVQNLTANDAITGQYVTDQSSGLFTNVFTLEPRRYGVAAGVKF